MRFRCAEIVEPIGQNSAHPEARHDRPTGVDEGSESEPCYWVLLWPAAPPPGVGALVPVRFGPFRSRTQALFLLASAWGLSLMESQPGWRRDAFDDCPSIVAAQARRPAGDPWHAPGSDAPWYSRRLRRRRARSASRVGGRSW